MPSCTLVAAVGFNPASILVTARGMKTPPDHLVLLCTEQTEHVAQTVARQIGAIAPVILAYDTNPPIENARTFLAENNYIPRDGEVILDITGATKSLCLALWLALSEIRTSFAAVYLEPDGRLRDARDGNPILATPHITPEEVLAWHSSRIQTSSWRGASPGLPAHYRERHALSKFLFSEFKNIAINTTGEALRKETSPPFPPLPPGFLVEDVRLCEPPHTGFFSENKWLEEFCLAEACDVLDGAEDVEAVMGADVRPTGAFGIAKDEFDVVMVRGARIAVVEAKARSHAGGGGAELQKRVAKTKKFFGDPAKLVFVHPAYNAAALADNQALVDSRTVRLVGDSIKDYRAAIRWALG